MIIRDIMTIKSGVIHSITPTQTVQEAIARMLKAEVGSMIVMQDGVMVGLLTERDVMRGLNTQGEGGFRQPVSSMMVTEPIIGSPEDTVDYVRGVMTENHITHLPVMENGQLLGIISFYDVARACMNAADFENRLLKRYIKHWPESE